MKKFWVVLWLLVLIPIGLFPLVSAEDFGCCANVYVLDTGLDYCIEPTTVSGVTMDECCPVSGTAYALDNLYRPRDRADCINNFWGSTCVAIVGGKCELGCCYDEGFGCEPKTESECKDVLGAQLFINGFSDLDQATDNPCYNQEGVAALDYCVPADGLSCSKFTYSDCINVGISGGCYWCGASSECVASCDSCVQPNPTLERICEGAVQADCSNSWRQQNSAECFSDNSNCVWCDSLSLSCIDTCYDCPSNNYDTNPVDRVCDSGTITQCSDGIDNDGWGGIDLDDFCCSSSNDNTEDNSCGCTSADGGSGYCCALNGQCEAAGGSLVHASEFDETTCAYCCNSPCDTGGGELITCEDGVKIKDTYLPLGYEFDYCICSGTPQDMTNPVIGNRFCCDGNVQNDPCVILRFYGTVKDTEGNPLPAAQITLQNLETSYSGHYSDFNGFFSFYVAEGDYTLKVELAGYATYSGLISFKTADVERNIVLEKVDSTCTNIIPAITLAVAPTQCQEEITLSWNFECSHLVSYWTIYKDGVAIQGSSNPDLDNYVDYNVDWGETYSYYVKARYYRTDLKRYEEKSSRIISASLGDEFCANKCGTDEFCYAIGSGDPVLRARCDENNIKEDIGDCRDIDPESICIGPTAGGTTYCDIPEVCETTALPRNILGMYYPHNAFISECYYEFGEKRYCYLDYSETTVDSCQSCDPKMFCYDYMSDYACDLDNCEVTKDAEKYDCTWFSDEYAYEELGKGICFAPRYEGKDYCELCSDENLLFSNAHCSPIRCDLLGSCYSDEDENNCLVCEKLADSIFSSTTVTKCEDMIDQRSCIGSTGIIVEEDQTFSMSKCDSSAKHQSSDIFAYSNDACDIGVCKWISGKCVKDADDDGKADCSSQDTSCQKDTVAPTTRPVEIPDRVNKESGSEVTFQILDKGWGEFSAKGFSSYFCVDTENQCCPDMPIVDKTIVLLGDGSIPGLVDVENPNVYLRFFSADGYDNIEPIKNIILNVDTKSPEFDVTYLVQDNLNDEKKSDVTISIMPDEYVKCTDSLSSISTTKSYSPKLSNAPVQLPDGVIVKYENLPDGWYKYSVSCRDDFGNLAEYEELISIDRMSLIINPQPVNEIFKEEEIITLSFETEGDAYECHYQMDGTSSKIPIPPVQDGLLYLYKKVLGTMSTGTYKYFVECYNSSNDLVDSEMLFFSVDSLPPETTLLYSAYTGTYLPFETGVCFQELSVKFLCDDQDPLLANPPGPFDCKEMKYCTSENNICTPTIRLSDPYESVVNLAAKRQSFFIRYLSEDKGGNKETLKSQFVCIDREPPVVTVTSPSEDLVTGQNTLVVSGTWQDDSQQVEIIISWLSESGTQSVEIISTDGRFSQQIELMPGENEITVTARDMGIVGGTNIGQPEVLTVYYDTVPPTYINVITKNHKNQAIALPSSYAASYGNVVKFFATLYDREWSNDVKSAKVTIECLDTEQCQYYLKTFDMSKVQTTTRFDFTYTHNTTDPVLVLIPGPYRVKYEAYDAFDNVAYYNQSFDVIDDSVNEIKIFNHLEQEIQTARENAHYGKSVFFQSKPSNFNIIEEALLEVFCIDPWDCGNYSKSFMMTKYTGALLFNHSIDPLVSGMMLPGSYNVSVTTTDNLQVEKTTLASFYVEDTITYETAIYNHDLARVDSLASRAKDAEYANRIIFNFTTLFKDMITEVRVIMRCSTPDLCQDYEKEMFLEKNNKGYGYVLTPVQGADAIFQPDIGTYDVVFFAKDTFDMYRTISMSFNIVDTLPPVIEITVDTPFYNIYTGIPKVGIGEDECLWYPVTISSNKPIDIDYFALEVFDFSFNQPPIMDFANFPEPVVSSTKDEWVYQLCIPYANPDYTYLRDTNSNFILSGEDLHGIAFYLDEKMVSSGTLLEIDTHGGDSPLLAGDEAIYTKEYSFELSGTTNPAEPTLTMHMNLTDLLDPDKEIISLSTTSSVYSNLLGQDVSYSIVSDGLNTVDISGNKVLLFASGKFLEFSNHARINGLRYEIISSTFLTATGTTRITISPELEAGISTSTKLYVFDTLEPTGWFGFNPTVSSPGKYLANVWAVDELNNIGMAEEKIIYVDDVAPVIGSYEPMDGTITSDDRPPIKLTIIDPISGIDIQDKTAINFTLNGKSYDCTNNLLCRNLGDSITVSFRYLADLENGAYDLIFNVKDRIGNTKQLSWSFTVDDNVPYIDDFSLESGIYHADPYNKWYVSVPTLTLSINYATPTSGWEFVETTGTIVPESPDDNFIIKCHNISSIRNYDAGAWTPMPDEVSRYSAYCRGIDSTISLFEADEEDDPIFDYRNDLIGHPEYMLELPVGTYSLTVRSKYCSWAAYGTMNCSESVGKWTYKFVIDTTPPFISFNEILPTTETSQHLTGKYKDLNMDERDSIMLSSDILSGDVSALLTTRTTFESDISMSSIAEGAYPITATATDKAGNQNSTTAMLIYDLSCTPFSVSEITSLSPDYNLIKVSDTEYATNIGVLRDYISIKGTAEAGTLILLQSQQLYDNTTSAETKTKTIYHDGNITFVLARLLQSNGMNYLKFNNTDLAGNTCSHTITIFSDTKAPVIPGATVKRGDTPKITFGSTGTPEDPPVISIDECLAKTSSLARDSCLINRMLAGDNEACSYLIEYITRVSC